MKRSAFIGAAVGLACAAGFAGCGDTKTGTAGGGSGDSGKPIKIGFAMGFTGATNAYDGPVFDGARVAIQDLNAKGGIDGRKIEIVKADTKSDLPSVAPAGLSVLEKGADVVVTSCDYDFGAPAAREANKQGKFAIGCAGDPLYGKQGIGPLTFNTLTGTPVEAGVMSALAQKNGWKRAYVLADTTIQYSKRGCDYVEQSFKASGITVAGKDTFQNADNSISPQVGRMKSADADFIVLCSFLPGATSAIRQIRSAGIDLPIVGQAGVDGRIVAGGVPKLSDLYYTNIGSLRAESPVAELRRLGSEYDKLTGGGLAKTQDYAPILGYAAIETIARAVAGAGSTDGAEMAKAVEGFKDEKLVTGATTYSSECHTPIARAMAVSKVEQGKVKVVEAALNPVNVPKAPC
jgi:branched-chain amino acid transport system substrate-binding protein